MPKLKKNTSKKRRGKKINGKKKDKCTKPKLNLKSEVIKPKFVDSTKAIFSYESPISYINNSQLAAIEPFTVSADKSSLDEDTIEITLQLPEKSWILLNGSSKFFYSARLKKSSITTDSDNKKVYGPWVGVDEDDSQNIVFYPNAFSKKFGSVTFLRNSQIVRTNRGFDRLSNAVESYIIAHIDPKMRRFILGANELDSSNLTGVKISEWDSSGTYYKEITKNIFKDAPFMASFSRLLCAPFPSEVSEDGLSLKSSVIPYYESINTQIRLSVEASDAYCFYQSKKNDEVRYKLFIEDFRFIAHRIRFDFSMGYEVKSRSIFGQCSRDRLLLPSLAYDIYTENVTSDSLWIEKIFRNVQIPNKLLVFLTDKSLIKTEKVGYSSTNTDFWIKADVSDIDLRWNDKVFFDNQQNIFKVSSSLMSFLNLQKLQRNFISGWRFSNLVNHNLIDSDDYIYPNFLFDFSLYNSPHDFIKPVLGSNITEPGNLSLRITFSSGADIKECVACFVFIYQDKFVSIGASNGDIASPLMGL